MIVSATHRFTLLSMPKCATTALIEALAPQADIVVRHPQGAKHANLRRYRRKMEPFLSVAGVDPARQEVVSVMREPLSWLESWWRYRMRPYLADAPQSTRGVSFETFVGEYLDDAPQARRLGRASSFVADSDGLVGVDRMFRYEDLGALVSWIEARTEWRLDLDRLNASPVYEDKAELSETMRARAARELALEYELYERADGGLLRGFDLDQGAALRRA